MQTILIVDDEQDIREIVSFNLTQAGYHCLMAANGKQAIEVLKSESIDLMLLDVMMPEMSGFELAKAIRNEDLSPVSYDLPIIFLTALGEEDDQLHGFSLGADDYISKPFSIRLLLARVEAVLKRNNTITSKPVKQAEEKELCYKTLCLNETTYIATIDGQDIGLTKMEYELLHFMLQHQETVYSRNELLTQVWPNNGLVMDRTVDVTLTRLRKKIGPYKDNLRTRTGYGYYWEK